MTPAALLALAIQCAPVVAPATLLSVVRAESGGEPLAIGVNGPKPLALHPASVGAALAQARALQARGADFDVGLAQINVRTLKRLGLPLERAFDPCRNLQAGAQLLASNYLAQPVGLGSPAGRLNAALSTYNTGDTRRGMRNGYVSRVYRAAAQVVPAIDPREAPAASGEDASAPVRLNGTPERASAPPRRRPSSSELDVFVQTKPGVLVWPGRSPSTPASLDASPFLPPSAGALR